jgi:hypothetical protein
LDSGGGCVFETVKGDTLTPIPPDYPSNGFADRKAFCRSCLGRPKFPNGTLVSSPEHAYSFFANSPAARRALASRGTFCPSGRLRRGIGFIHGQAARAI